MICIKVTHKHSMRKLTSMTNINPDVAKAPILEELEAGTKKAWCSCGYSTNQPYCDGSHSRNATSLRPVIVEITETKKYAWCACKATGNPPFCDGSHKNL